MFPARFVALLALSALCLLAGCGEQRPPEADWSQPALAGRALLQRNADGWSVVLCAGNELLDPAIIEAAGASLADARLLVMQLSRTDGNHNQ